MNATLTPELPEPDRPRLLGFLVDQFKAQWAGRGIEVSPGVEAMRRDVEAMPDLVVSEQLKRFIDRGRVW